MIMDLTEHFKPGDWVKYPDHPDCQQVRNVSKDRLRMCSGRIDLTEGHKPVKCNQPQYKLEFNRGAVYFF